MKLHLDPRTKLYLLLLSNLTLFFHVSLSAEILLVAMLLSLFFLSGRGQSGIRLLVTYGILVSFDLFVIPYASGVVLNFISMFTVGIRMMLPCMISGTYLFSTTPVGEMVCGFRKLKLPEAIIVPSVTVLSLQWRKITVRSEMPWLFGESRRENSPCFVIRRSRWNIF